MATATELGEALWDEVQQRAETLASAVLIAQGSSIAHVDRDSFDLGVSSGAAAAMEALRDHGMLGQ